MKIHTSTKTQRNAIENKKIIKNSAKLVSGGSFIGNIIKTIAISIILMCIFIVYNNTLSSIVPLNTRGNTSIDDILFARGAPVKDIPHIAKAIKMAARQTDVSEYLILALMYTESAFDKEAVSVSGYYGLMQIPSKYNDIAYIDVNVLMGARIFKEKLYMTHGDIRKAIILYKGWKVTDEKGIYNADKVIRISKDMINNNI